MIQQQFCELIKILNQENLWTLFDIRIFDECINEIESSQTIEKQLFNQLIDSALQTDFKGFLQKCKLIHTYGEELLTKEQLTKIINCLNGELMSKQAWMIYQEDVLQLQDLNEEQKIVIYNHMRRYYQTNLCPYELKVRLYDFMYKEYFSESIKRINHDFLQKEYVQYLLESCISKRKDNEIQSIKHDLLHLSIEQLIQINLELKQVFQITRYNNDFIIDYYQLVYEELQQFIVSDTHTLIEKLNIFNLLIYSIDQIKLKTTKKQVNPINQIYIEIQKYLFKEIVENNYMLEYDGKVDLFAQDLIKTQKQKVGKWKEQHDQVMLQIKQLNFDASEQLLQISKLLNQNQQGTLYVHYALIKQLTQSLQKNPNQIEIIYYLTKIDKLYLLDNINLIDCNQEEILKLLYHNILALKMNLVPQCLQQLQASQITTKEEKSQIYLLKRLLELEFPSLTLQCGNYKQEFQDYWLEKFDEQDQLCQDVKAYLQDNKYQISYNSEVDIWRFLFVQDSVVILCISKKMYLGDTNQLLIEVPILKRMLRYLDIKLRILDYREYMNLGTRHAKNAYIEERLKNLSKESESEKQLYYNY